MSSDQSPTGSAGEPQSTTPQKQRNPVERIIVWGLIVAMVALCAREAMARFGYTNSLNSLQAALAADDDGHTLMIDKVPDHLSGSPTREIDEANRVVTYHWSGLLKDYGSIHIQYSRDDEVLGLLTADAPPVEPVVVLSDDDPDAADSQHGAAPAGMGDGSGGGREAGGRRFDPMQFDADGDGKLSLEEAPDRIKQRFADIDTNSDGFLDEEEFAARRAARERERSSRPDRPARPDDDAEAAGSGDESAPSEETPQEEAADDQPEASATDGASSDSGDDESKATTEESDESAN